MDILSRLDLVARGEFSPAEALKLARAAVLGDDKRVQNRAYTAVRERTWQYVKQSSPLEDARLWLNSIQHISSLLADKGDEVLAERLRGMSELLLQSLRFADLQPVADALERKHVRKLLETLLAKGGSAKRAIVSKALGVEDSNLSRILTIVCPLDLVERQSHGKEAILKLTAKGREAIEGSKHDAFRAAHDLNAHAIARWDTSAGQVVMNKLFSEICQRTLINEQECNHFHSWYDAIQDRSVAKEAADSEGTLVLKHTDGRWIRVSTRQSADEIVATVEDITADREREHALRMHIRQLAGEISERNRKDEKFSNAVREFRDRLLQFADGVDVQISTALDATEHAGKQKRLKTMLEMARSWLVGLRVTARDYFPLPLAETLDDGSRAWAAHKTAINPKDWARDIQRTAELFGKERVTVKVSGMETVVGSADLLNATVGQLLLTNYKGLNPSVFESKIAEDQLVLSVGLKSSKHYAGTTPHTLHQQLQMRGVENLGLEYCRDLVQSYGGTFLIISAGKQNPKVQVVFPLRREERSGFHNKQVETQLALAPFVTLTGR
ncbi:hypothetical protein MUU53_02505 [Rhizobium lemnae]|uniref:Uncharacterized protein n=1 Tax=Rhizobium lemnae TaxID=1214924 RepID=A0ABV8E4D9_9HYPH|nr:hypothetical protein [Rhizobium lemnae]MCJ8506779.1 hypothetical protein [Rhizobium lemnae]